ncbi:MAG: CPBP family glutamic-type intramembrane protease [Erythrobacter sp.]|nr:CPBP family glutamic-type intramembrane protease [Erythrobacter sp.]
MAGLAAILAAIRARVGDAARFMARPTPHGAPLPWGGALLLALGTVFALDLALDGLAAWLTALADSYAPFLPAERVEETTLAEDLFGYLLLAPVLEELVYRGWLTGRVAALRFAAFGFAAQAMLFATLFLDAGLAMPVALGAVALVLAGLVQWSATRERDTAVPEWFTRHFHWFVWGSTLLFGLVHLGNYEALSSPWGVLVVLPQTIGGLLLAYTRTRLGLRAAMLHHAAYNALFLASDYGWW